MKRIIVIFLLALSYIPGKLIAQANNALSLPVELQNVLLSDSSQNLYISDILISGNKKTKTYLIKREMLLHKGDSVNINSLSILISKSQNLIYNTNLFTQVEILPILRDSNKLILLVDLKEKWYIYPLPQFQLIARNLNDWVNTYNADLNRVVYGLKFAHYNLSGRRDQLNIYLLNGYSRNISMRYVNPYSNPALTRGFSLSAGYTSYRVISYKTNFENKILQYNNDKFVNNSFTIGGAYTIRNGYYLRHTLGLNFQVLKIDKLIIKDSLNKYYFNSEKEKQFIPDLAYTLQYLRVDNAAYPLKGIAASLQLLKRGPDFTGGINMTQLSGAFSKYITHKKNWYSTYSLQAKIKAPFDLAYINQSALGYGDYNLRGLEYYVVDGPVSAVAKYTLKKKVISFNIPLPFRLKTIPNIPISIFLKGYGDIGFAYNKNQYKAMLNNKLLYTGGFGMDILTVYDINLRIEYSFNQLKENGLFLHSNGGF